MGSGKTVIGRHIARLLEYSFADTDEEIREVTGMELPQFFRKYGEIRFRSEEKLVIRKLANKDHQVIACGGSMSPLREGLDMFVDNGFFVMLTASPEVILSRISRKNNRILPMGKPSIADIAAMLKQRQECFSDLIHISVDTGEMGVEEAAEYIASKYCAYIEQC